MTTTLRAIAAILCLSLQFEDTLAGRRGGCPKRIFVVCQAFFPEGF